LLTIDQRMQGVGLYLSNDFVDETVPAQAADQHGRFEGGLADPVDSGGGDLVAVATGGDHEEAVGNHAQDFAFNLWVHEDFPFVAQKFSLSPSTSPRTLSL